MAINEHLLRFILYGRRTFGLSLAQTLTLGRQHCLIAPRRLLAIAARCEELRNVDPSLIRNLHGKFAEPLFALLGANTVDSIDASPFEDASIVHDLNNPLPDVLSQRYTCVIDGGTLEHVFSISTAMFNAMRAVTVGGHFVSIAVANNFFGHGFFQLSPEFFFRLLVPSNGFEVQSLVVCEASDPRRWYEVRDPATMGRRVTLVNKRETFMMVLARRTAAVDELTIPQQSDYQVCWALRRTDARSATGAWGRFEAFRPIWRKLSQRQQELVRRYFFGLRGLDPAFFARDAYALSGTDR